jgi:hypothetical protein
MEVRVVPLLGGLVPQVTFVRVQVAAIHFVGSRQILVD